MKLEIKHLSPYLPYGLKLYDTYTKSIYLNAVRGETLDYLTIGENDSVKPILRPLSDLARKIQFRGNKVFPVDIIKDYCGYEIITNKERIVEPLTMLPYLVFNLLCEMHFDMFNLIEKGLAISIHETNPSL
jgi:hypothetical protein